MKRLWVQFAAIVVAAIVLTVVIQVSLGILGLFQHYQKLNPEFRRELERVQDDERLSEAELNHQVKELFVAYLETDAGFTDVSEFIDASLAEQLRVAILFGLAALPIGIIFAVFLARYISTPISRVSEAAQQVARGDLSVRAKTTARSRPGSEMSILIRNFNAMAESLERLERERKVMIADIAHELRTPLTVLQGQIDAVRYGVISPDDEAMSKLSRHTELLLRLVKDLRTLSLADAQQLTLERSPTDVAGLLRDLVDLFQEEAKEHGISLGFLTPLQRPLHLNLDADRMTQVFINLLSNALRHTPESGSAEVRLEQLAHEVVISVRDTGEGLSPEALEKAFTRFYRADPSRDRATGGSGLGLAIAKEIVELHGGRITASNAAEGGAVFTVYLPLQNTLHEKG